MSDPLDHVEWVPAEHVHPNPWNPNHVAPQEMRLLERSLLLTGWVQPLLVSPRPDGGYLLIDGYHRLALSRNPGPVRQRWGGLVPVAVLDLDRETAMLLTVRINRAKGTHASTLMSRLVRDLLAAGVTVERLCEEMGATPAEVDLLAQEDVFRARPTGPDYSRAWHPREDGRKASQVAAERTAR